MRKLFLIVVTLGALSIPGVAQESYTDDDLMNGEEVRITAETLDATIIARLEEKQATSYQLAILAQIIDDSILCNLLMTKLVIDAYPEMSLSRTAQKARAICLIKSIQLKGALKD